MTTEEAAPASASRDTPRKKSSQQQRDRRRATPPDNIDWRKRYADLRPEYDRVQRELKFHRQLVEGARLGVPTALELLGIQVPEAQDSEPGVQTPTNNSHERPMK